MDINIHLVLRAFKLSLLASSQPFRIFKSLFIAEETFCCCVVVFIRICQICVISKKATVRHEITSGRSLIYIRNRSEIFCDDILLITVT